MTNKHDLGITEKVYVSHYTHKDSQKHAHILTLIHTHKPDNLVQPAGIIRSQ